MMPENERASTPRWIFVIAFAPAVFTVAAAMLQPWVRPEQLFRDPLTVAHRAAAVGDCCHLYFGFVSNIGVLLWAATVGVCAFAAITLSGRSSALLASASVLSIVLLVDDLFQAHEYVYPALFSINEKVVVAGYAVAVAAYLVAFRKSLLASGPGLLVCSLAFFAISVGSDLTLANVGDLYRVLDDGAKFVGLAFWTAFHLRISYVLVTERFR
ncbi:MAG: hypothetical protein GY711_16435 [bacterium]|nr:hypothetical protein [bacterium]